MQLKISVKQLGKKRPIIDQEIIEIESLPRKPTLKHLIEAVVKQQVEKFNEKIAHKPIVSFLLKEEILDQLKNGKISFGEKHNEDKANLQQAIDNALLAFTDGIYCVFVDEEQIEDLEKEIQLTNESIVAFIRLTFLAGSYW